MRVLPRGLLERLIDSSHQSRFERVDHEINIQMEEVVNERSMQEKKVDDGDTATRAPGRPPAPGFWSWSWSGLVCTDLILAGRVECSTSVRTATAKCTW